MSTPRQTAPSPRGWIGFDADADPPQLGWSGPRGMQSLALEPAVPHPPHPSSTPAPAPGAPADAPTGSPRARRERPKRVLASRLNQGRRCLALMPSRYCLYRTISPPAIGSRRARRLLPGILDLELPFPIEQCETRFTQLSQATGTPQALALAVRHVDIDARLEALRQQGCNPQVLLPEPWVAWQHAQAVFTPFPDTALRIVRLRRGAEQTLMFGRSHGMLSCSTGPAHDQGHLLHLLREAHDPQTDAPCVLLHVEASATAPPDEERDTAIKVIIPDDPDGWMARALAACAGAEARQLDLRRARNLHPVVARQIKAVPRQLALALSGAAILTFGTQFYTVTRAEALASEAQSRLQTDIDRLAGYTVTRRGPEAIEALSAALNERISPPIEAWDRPDALATLKTLFDAARETGVLFHDIRCLGADWTLHASADSRQAAQSLIASLARRGESFSASFDESKRQAVQPVEFVMRSN